MLPVFGVTHFICLKEAKQFYLVLEILEIFGFSRHLYAYRVSFRNKWNVLKCDISIVNRYNVTSLVKSANADYFIIQEQ